MFRLLKEASTVAGPAEGVPPAAAEGGCAGWGVPLRGQGRRHPRQDELREEHHQVLPHHPVKDQQTDTAFFYLFCYWTRIVLILLLFPMVFFIEKFHSQCLNHATHSIPFTPSNHPFDVLYVLLKLTC